MTQGTLRLKPMLRPVAWMVLVTTLSACGGGRGGSSRDPGFDFVNRDFNGIAIVPLDAYQDQRLLDGSDETLPTSALREELRGPATSPRDAPFMIDWNAYLSNGEDVDLIRYFITYEIEWSPTTGCVLHVRIFEGLPWDPLRAPIDTHDVTVGLGEAHHDGFVIAGEQSCLDEAAFRVAQDIIASDLFSPGWSHGSPEHAQ